MKSPLVSLLAVFGLLATAALHAADAPSPEELEAKFKATFTAATMSGRWFPLKDGALGDAKDDKYSIVKVEKGEGSSWVMHAKMLGFVIPIPVQVKWAGDTAVIIVDKMRLPGGNAYEGSAYSARVMVYEHTYSGTWNGGDHGGMLTGTITNQPAK